MTHKILQVGSKHGATFEGLSAFAPLALVGMNKDTNVKKRTMKDLPLMRAFVEYSFAAVGKSIFPGALCDQKQLNLYGGQKCF